MSLKYKQPSTRTTAAAVTENNGSNRNKLNTKNKVTMKQTANNATQRFNLKVQIVNTEHTTKFSMTVGEVYIRKDGQATAYAVGHKEPFERREDAIGYIQDVITEFCEVNGFGVEFKDVTPAPIETVEV